MAFPSCCAYELDANGSKPDSALPSADVRLISCSYILNRFSHRRIRFRELRGAGECGDRCQEGKKWVLCRPCEEHAFADIREPPTTANSWPRPSPRDAPTCPGRKFPAAQTVPPRHEYIPNAFTLRPPRTRPGSRGHARYSSGASSGSAVPVPMPVASTAAVDGIAVAVLGPIGGCCGLVGVFEHHRSGKRGGRQDRSRCQYERGRNRDAYQHAAEALIRKHLYFLTRLHSVGQ